MSLMEVIPERFSLLCGFCFDKMKISEVIAFGA